MLVVAMVGFGVAVSQFVDLDALSRATTREGADSSEVNDAVLKLMGLSVALTAVAVAAYITLQAIAMRWWLEALRIGPLAVATTLRKRSIVGAYLRCFLYVALLVTILATAMSLALGTAVGLGAPDDVGQLVMVGAGVVAYLGMALVGWVLYQTTVKLRVWRLAVNSITLAGFEAIADVRADSSLPSSAVGEGLADALGAGGI
jgi:hypothetical protein